MKKISGFILVLTTLLLVAACGGENSLEKKKSKIEKLKTQQAEIISQIKTLEDEIFALGDSGKSNERFKMVAVTPVTKTPFEHYIDVQGRVDGDENTTISSRAMGPVTKVYVHPGMQVKEGQILAEIDAEIVKRQMDDLKVNLGFVTDVFNKQKALWEKQVGSEIQYLSAKNNKESLEQKMSTLKEQLEMYKIKSPITGAIDEVFIKIGQNVAPGLPCFRIVNFSHLKVKADVAETYAQAIKEGSEVIIRFPDLNNLELRSSISFTAKVISQMNRTFTVESQLPSDKQYIPNMIAVLRIIDYKQNNSVVVPINTVQNSEGHKFVFIAVNESGKYYAKKRDVIVGKTYNEKAEIISGLSEADLLITTGYQELNDNETIKY